MFGDRTASNGAIRGLEPNGTCIGEHPVNVGTPVSARPLANRILHVVSYTPPELELDQLEAAVRGDVRLVLNGQELDLWLTPDARAAYEQAKNDRFVLRRPFDDALAEVWLHWCKAACEPSVVVTVGPVFATLRLDLFPTGRWLNSRAQAAIASVLLRETDHVEFLDGTYVGPEICQSCWVPPERARRVAAALYRIARTCLDQAPEAERGADNGVV